MMQNVLRLQYQYMELKLGKSLSFPMILSNGTESTLIPSKVDSITMCLSIQLVYDWGSILMWVPRCISPGMTIELIVMSCVLMFILHTNLNFLIFWYRCNIFSLNRLPTVRKVEIPSTCGCDLVTDGHMNLWLVEMMYCEYWIGPNQRSLTLQRDLNFQVMQVQFLLVVKENYLLHRLASLKGLQPNSPYALPIYHFHLIKS